jgi:hypothetical protein
VSWWLSCKSGWALRGSGAGWRAGGCAAQAGTRGAPIRLATGGVGLGGGKDTVMGDLGDPADAVSSPM